MDSDLQHPQQSIHLLNDRSQQQKPMASGLTRYQSAPSSYFSSFLDRDLCDELLNRPSSPETERIFARFLANSESLASQSFLEPKQDPAVAEAEQAQSSTVLFQQQQQQQQGFYQSQSRSPPPLPPPHPPPAFLDQNPGPPGIDYVGPQLKVGIGSSLNTSNLVRHSSSPAGFFANVNVGMENGYPLMRGMGDYGAVNRDASYPAASRPPPTPSSSGRMSPIAEIGSKNMGDNSAENIGRFGVANRGSNVTSFPSGSWDDIAEDDKSFLGLNESENQGGEAGTPPRMLSHHLSLHKTSAEMAALEKILHFQDSVPCKTRAKRGFATHPRSIAERMLLDDLSNISGSTVFDSKHVDCANQVRRTKISERMRKLQDLVPNMDKQTNTADMLDLAVDYIKDLQGQVKGLQENRAKCMCPKDTHQQ